MRADTYIAELLTGLIKSRGHPWPDKTVIEPPKDAKFGDMASNIALVSAKALGRKPRDLAEEIRAEILEKSSADIHRVDVAGPGFLNFFFTPGFWQRTVTDILNAGDDYGASDFGQGTKVQVEFVSANPTGPLHIGHGRGAAVGDSLARIMKFTGYDVATEYYLNDAGRQMNLLGLSVYTRLRELAGENVELPQDCYKGDYIIDLARELHVSEGQALLDAPEAEAIEQCRVYAVNAILDEIKKDLARFRVGHDVWFSEKSLIEKGEVEKTLARLKQKGFAYDKDGAVWFKSTEFGDEKDRVLVKSDGALTYFASDIAYHDDKYGRGFNMLVDIWGADHHGYVPRMKAMVQALGYDPETLQIILVQLVNLLRGGEQVAMSTRAGSFVTLAEVVDEVGVDAARFYFLTRKSDSHLDFDLDLVKSATMDNPVYYVQYAHARICSVMRKAAERGIPVAAPEPSILAGLDTKEDLELLKHLDRFPDVLTQAAKTLSPHHPAYYLMELAGGLHRYYTVNPVLTADTESRIQARLNLLKAVAQVVKNGLALLGVHAPDSM